MLELFRLEADEQVLALTEGLLKLERAPTAADQLEGCMRAAHSLKGAARIVGLEAGVSIAHSLEDCFVAAQRGEIVLRRTQVDLLLRGVDLLNRIATTPGAGDEAQITEQSREVDAFLAALATTLTGSPDREPAQASSAASSVAPIVDLSSAAPGPPQIGSGEVRDSPGRALRVSAQQLNRLVGVAAEALVESRRLKLFAESLLRLKRQDSDVAKAFNGLREALPALDSRAQDTLDDVYQKILSVHANLAERLNELETFDRRSTTIAHRVYDEALACRMRPFADATVAFPRMVRDLAAALDKDIRLEIVGRTTWLDRDILERLDAPLGHLLRNAMDHGIESRDERSVAGKAAEAVLTLEATHSAGLLQITLSDDGRGIDADKVRAAVVRRNLTTADVAGSLSEAELFEFLFLPGFSLKDTVSEISGRGVGLDVVHDMLKQVGGSVRVTSQLGKGSRFQLQLPLSLSVVRSLLAAVGGEPYAFPLAYIVRTLNLHKDDIESVEGRQLFTFDGRPVGLVGAHQILHGGSSELPSTDIPVVVVGSNNSAYGLVVERFLGERELVVQSLDPRLGKVKNIANGALMEDGSPTLIVDVDDLIRSIETLLTAGRLSTVAASGDTVKKKKRVLVVDDSLTVRELERKLLDTAGYEVAVAVNGMDGWNLVRTTRFDLVVTDIDMPRMDGIELVTLMKSDLQLKSVPVIIVSYKDREEDRRRGLEAGADYFLSKGSFHDETLLQAVIDLIGEAGA